MWGCITFGGMAVGQMGRQLFDFVTRSGVRWQKMPSPFEKFVYPDFTFDQPDDETRYRQALVARYPQEREAIETYFKDLHAGAGWYGAQIVAQAVPRPLAALIRIASHPRRALALSTTGAYLNAHVRDPQLRSKPASQGDFRAHLPRFTGENRERNQRLIDALQTLAAEKGVSVSQLAIAWVLSKDSTIVPVIGARTRTQLTESLGALQVTLTPAELARVEEAVPAAAVAGSRYDEHQMRILDSERSAQ